MFVRVFIGKNDSLVCIYHKCGKKNVWKWLKMCKLNVENLTKVEKTFVLQLWPPANVRELTRAHASGAWLKSHRAYNVHELRHAAWLNSRRGIFENHVERECFVLGGRAEFANNLWWPLLWGLCPSQSH